MNTIRSIISWLLPVAILVAATAIFFWMGSQAPPERKKDDLPTAMPVKTTAVEKAVGKTEIDTDGVVVPLREVTLAAEVAGRITQKTANCRAGRFVKAGTELFEIDRRDYELDVARLEGELRQAAIYIQEIDEELAQNVESTHLAEQQVALARRDVKRLDGLRADRIITESEHDKALREELTVMNSLSSLQGQKRVLSKRRSRLVEAQSLAATLLERAELDLSRTKIVAPTDGVIVDDRVEQNSFVAKGTPLVTLEDTSAAEVKTSLRMDEVARIWGGRDVPQRQPGGAPEDLPAQADDATNAIDANAYDIPPTPVSVIFKLGTHRYRWQGTLSRQEGRGLDEKSRTLPCRVLVPEPTKVESLDAYGEPLARLPPEAPRSLFRGMFVQVEVHIDASQELVSIPEEAVHPSGDVFVLRDGMLVVIRPPIEHSGRGRVFFIEDQSGLSVGDRVVISQIAVPRNGMLLTEAQ